MAIKPPGDVQDAFYRVVHDFGVQLLANKMGVSAGVLYNKANANDTSHHKPTLGEAVLVTNLTNDKRIAQALAVACGGVFLDLPDLSLISDMALLECISKIAAEGGEFHTALLASLSDNRIHRDEFWAIQTEAFQWIAAIGEALARIEGIVE